jgi:hypothetical protein
MSRDYEWLIGSRSRIQASLLALHRMLPALEAQAAVEAAAAARSSFGLLVGAAFALWRAAFLEDISREWPDVLSGAKALLEKLLESNSILFGDERATKNWMGGYYINNARYRLIHLSEKIPPGSLDADALASLETLRQANWTERTTPQTAWDAAHALLATMIKVVRAQLEGVSS